MSTPAPRPIESIKLVRSSGRPRLRPTPPARGRAVRPIRPGRRLAAVGALVWILGLGAAGTLYWANTHRHEPTLDELLPGYSRAHSRQMGIFYGELGVMMWEWREGLARPATQAMLIVAVSSVIATACFRVAWLRADAERRDWR